MLATRWPRPFDDREWQFEVKWDGVRILLFFDGTSTVLRTRRGLDFTSTYPEIASIAPDRPCVLDGEAIAFDAQGRASFGLLQHRTSASGERHVAEAAQVVPVSYVVFDVLFDRRPIIDQPLEERTSRLPDLGLPSQVIRSESVRGEGLAFFEAVDERGLEGMVAKRLGSTYRPGARSPEWRKIAAVRRAQAVVGGFTPGTGHRVGAFGALLLGLFVDSELRYIGSVGTGFTEATLLALRDGLDQITVSQAPFAADSALPKNATWVSPALVAEIEFKEWTAAGRLRAPSFKGLTVVDPQQVTWRDEGPNAS